VLVFDTELLYLLRTMMKKRHTLIFGNSLLVEKSFTQKKKTYNK